MATPKIERSCVELTRNMCKQAIRDSKTYLAGTSYPELKEYYKGKIKGLQHAVALLNVDLEIEGDD